MSQLSTLWVHLEFTQRKYHDVLKWLTHRKCSVHSQFPRSHDQGFPIRQSVDKPWIFPKKVPVICQSGLFKVYFPVFPAVWSQFPKSVKFKMNQTDAPEVFPSGTFRMPSSFQLQCSTLSIFLANFENSTRTLSGVKICLLTCCCQGHSAPSTPSVKVAK